MNPTGRGETNKSVGKAVATRVSAGVSWAADSTKFSLTRSDQRKVSVS